LRVTTIHPDGTPRVDLSWAADEGDKVAMASLFDLGRRRSQRAARPARGRLLPSS
jgi:hypothetical protein